MTEVSAAKMILRRNFERHLRSHKLGLYFDWNRYNFGEQSLDFDPEGTRDCESLRIVATQSMLLHYISAASKIGFSGIASVYFFFLILDIYIPIQSPLSIFRKNLFFPLLNLWTNIFYVYIELYVTNYLALFFAEAHNVSAISRLNESLGRDFPSQHATPLAR